MRGAARNLLAPALAALLAAAPLSPALHTSATLLAQEIPRANPAEAGLSAERLDRLTGVLQDYVDQGRLPGAVALVLRDGRIVYEEAVGERDREADAELATDAIFRIASQTKAIVSVAVMMLQEEGALLTSDPVSRYLPAFEHTTVASSGEGNEYEIVEAERAITLRDLLTHTAGVGYGSGPGGDRWSEAGLTGWYLADRDEPIRATVERMAALPFPAQPGEAFVYGYSTDILGAVVEEVSGMPLDRFLRTRIFEPLAMQDTHFYLPPEKRDRLAVVYNLREGEELTRAPDGAGMQAQGQYVDGPRTTFSGGAGLLSSARDYARFLQMLLNGGTLDGTRLLSPASVALMTTDQVGDLYGGPGMGFGLGFRIRLEPGADGRLGSVGEYGWGGAYHSTYWVDPVEDLVVVYLTQVVPAAGLDDHEKLRALLYGAITSTRHDMP